MQIDSWFNLYVGGMRRNSEFWLLWCRKMRACASVAKFNGVDVKESGEAATHMIVERWNGRLVLRDKRALLEESHD